MINAPSNTEDKIRVLAHKFWEEEGRPEGRAEAHWLRIDELDCTKDDCARCTPHTAACNRAALSPATLPAA
jgi:hypothetical protein